MLPPYCVPKEKAWETPIYDQMAFMIMFEPGDPYWESFWDSTYFNYPWGQT
jgi:hypothetical protein